MDGQPYHRYPMLYENYHPGLYPNGYPAGVPHPAGPPPPRPPVPQFYGPPPRHPEMPPQGMYFNTPNQFRPRPPPQQQPYHPYQIQQRPPPPPVYPLTSSPTSTTPPHPNLQYGPAPPAPPRVQSAPGYDQQHGHHPQMAHGPHPPITHGQHHRQPSTSSQAHGLPPIPRPSTVTSPLPPPQPRLPARRTQTAPETSSHAPSGRRTSSQPQPPPRIDSGSKAIMKKHDSGSSVSTLQVYPCMESMVAQYLLRLLPRGVHVKDSLEYTDCFVGRDCVDTIAYIIKTTDRNLALLLGRALDAQGFFGDVTYNHRLRDSSNELYRFKSTLAITGGPESTAAAIEEDEEGLPNGVFTLLTDCYSPTCTREKLCYSIACPRRLEQQTRLLSQTASQLQRSASRSSMRNNEPSLWQFSVPKEIVDSVSEMERRRQEAIFETIKTEREYLADLELLQKVFIEPLRKSGVIPPLKVETLIRDVFINVQQLQAINSQLLVKLNRRQKESPIVDKIGDIFLSSVDSFEAYIEYGSRQLYAKLALDNEMKVNPGFAKFLQECQSLPECRKLPIHSFLGRPTSRMGRYPLLLRDAFKRSAENHPDRTLLPQAMDAIKNIMDKINREAGRAENRIKLTKLQESLSFYPGEQVDLRLMEEGRVIAREGHLVLRKGGADTDLHVFLLDHVLLLTKKKKGGSYKVYKKPIPLELLVFGEAPTANRRASGIFGQSQKAGGLAQTPTVKGMALKGSDAPVVPTPQADVDKTYPFTIVHLGRQSTAYALHAASEADRTSWRQAIEYQKLAQTERKNKFEIVALNDDVFPLTNRINASVSVGGQLMLATDDGLYVGPESNGDEATDFKKVIELEKISQVDVLPEHDIITLLADKTLMTFPLDILSVTPQEATLAARKGHRVASHVAFFKQGVCNGQVVCSAVKLTALNSTVKVFEPRGGADGKKRGKMMRLLFSGEESLKCFKEFYIPAESSSIHYLKTKLCVGCTKGFEIVDLQTLSTQGLLDPNDEKLEFVTKRETSKPISIFRIRDGDFLLCYNDFGFYVDRFGRRSRPDWLIQWSGAPTAFSFIMPYVIAFEPSFIEVRHVDTGELQQIIPTNNMRALNTDPGVLQCVMDSASGDHQCIFKLRQIPDKRGEHDAKGKQS